MEGCQTPASPIEESNRAYLEGIERVSAGLRHEIISSSFDALKVFWRQQQKEFDALALNDWPEGAKLNYYILKSSFSFPEEQLPQPALTMVLKPPHWSEGDQSKERIEVIIPLVEDVPADENLALEMMPLPPRVGVEYSNADGVVTSYVIDENGLRAFDHPFESDTIESELDSIDDEARFRAAFGSMQGKQTSIDSVMQICLDLLNWKVQIQRISHVGDPEITDI